MVDTGAKPADAPSPTTESIAVHFGLDKASAAAPDIEMKDADADGDADADADADADGEEDTTMTTATQAKRETAGQKANADADVDADGDDDEDADGEVDDDDDDDGVHNSLQDLLMVIENTANYLSTFREPDGYQIAAGFQRIPNRRLIPDYYDVIQEPIAFSTIRTKRSKREYSDFKEFVRDVALIAHNAQVYNRPSSTFFQDAGRLREVFKEELKKMVDDGTITAEDAVFPDLGEIPEAEDSPPESQAGDSGEEEEEEEEGDSDSDNDDHRRERRGSRAIKDEEAKKRARPPKVFTPLEARIHNLLKGLRRFKNSDGDLLVDPFEKLPDRTAMPDYYTAIQNPISLHEIKRKHKRKKYPTVEHAVADLDLMFENAKTFNEDGSEIFEAAVELQKQARVIANQEKAKPDNAFADEDGRRPVAEIAHNGDMWRVGDWVHITNPNDIAKPIVAQIYRTWEDKTGQKWVNACWYYRPEQTVHRFEKHFYEHEVVKTGQYRDHRIQEVIDRCFVMFITRFPKGRPRGLSKDKAVYVCESRYNEEKHRFAKIKTWASCIPDEVRERDYQMEMFDQPRRLRKVPSPIKHLLRDDAKPTDPIPKPTWGASNAPPMIGAVHCRARESNESPPPEPTPPPPPMNMNAVRRPSAAMGGDVMMGNTQQFQQYAPPTPTPGHTQNSFAPRFAPSQGTSVPAPQYGSPAVHHQGPVPQQAHFQPHQQQQGQMPMQQYNGYGQQQQQYTNSPVPAPQIPQYPGQGGYPAQQHMAGYDNTQRLAPSPARANSIALSPGPSVMQPHHPPSHHQQGPPQQHQQLPQYNVPRANEVYSLDDNVDAQIPREIRQQFQCDEQGRVMFFTQPPLDRNHPGISEETASTLGHSAKYLADRERIREEREKKRKARDELREQEAGKRKEVVEREAERRRAGEIDLAGDLYRGWIRGMEGQAVKLGDVYGGWSVRDEIVDQAVKN